MRSDEVTEATQVRLGSWGVKCGHRKSRGGHGVTRVIPHHRGHAGSQGSNEVMGVKQGSWGQGPGPSP